MNAVSELNDRIGLAFFASIFIALYSTMVGLRYLQGRADKKDHAEHYIKPLQQKVSELESAFRRLSDNHTQAKIPQENWEDIKDEATAAAVSELTDSIQRDIYRNSLLEGTYMLRSQLFDRMNKRLSSLERRANFSLVFGVLFAAIGIAAIYFSFFSPSSAAVPSNTMSALLSYAPRLSLVLIIEAVAFFFLRLYSKAIDEIRYTENEFTNVEMKLIGLDESHIAESDAAKQFALERLSETERNHVLKAGETTIEIEKARFLNSMISSGNESFFKSLFSKKAE